MSEKECRFCLDEHETKSNRLISPCSCKGTQKYVHEVCLNGWRNLNKESINYTNCNECNVKYIISSKYPIEKCVANITWKYMSFTFCLYYATTGVFYAIVNNIENSFSLATFYSSTSLIGVFFLYTLRCIFRKKVYVTFATIPFLYTLFFAFHFQYNKLFFDEVESNTYFTFYMSIINVLPFFCLLNTHNTILHIMNNTENYEITENYLLDFQLV
jgi:hypothetical protein